MSQSQKTVDRYTLVNPYWNAKKEALSAFSLCLTCKQLVFKEFMWKHKSRFCGRKGSPYIGSTEYVVGSRMSKETLRLANMRSSPVSYGVGVTAGPIANPPKQIHNWNCYVCKTKCASFDEYIAHQCSVTRRGML